MQGLDQLLILQWLRSVWSLVRQRSVAQTSRCLYERWPVEFRKEALDEGLIWFGFDEFDLDVLKEEREVVRCRLTCFCVAREEVVC